MRKRMKSDEDNVVWKAVGRYAVRFVNGNWASDCLCRSHREALRTSERYNEEEDDR